MRLGYLAGGKLLTAIVLLLLICLLLSSAEATGHIVWQKHLGGSKSDVASSIIQTDNGYVVAGRADALIADDGDVKGNRGYWDYWIVNLSSSGNLIWKKCLGGIWDETAYSIIRTDGGYIVAGSTHSKDGDASDIHRDEECKNDKCDSCPADFWVVKLKSSGKMEWQKCLGGTKDDVAYSINQTTDGGYIVAGYTESNDGDAKGLHGGKDFWVVKVGEGEINCTIAAPDSVCPRSTGNVASTAEPGAVYVWTIDNGTITSANNTQSITFTARAYGPVSLKVYVEKYGYLAQCYKDIPVALANCSWTSKSPVCINSRVFFYGPAGMDSYQWDFGDGSQGSGRNPSHTYLDTGNYKVRLNTTLRGCSKICTGTVMVLSGPKCSWTSKSYVCEDEKVQFTGPAMMDSCYRELGDGQNSTAEDPSHLYSHLGTRNVNLTVSCCGSQRTGAGPVAVRQPARANRSCIEWQKCLGGSEDDEAKSVRRTADGGYIVAGYTKSNNGDVSGCHGKEDFWVVKLNATGNLTWQRCLGGSGDDRAQSVRQTADGGYIVAGYTYSNNGDVKGLHGESDYWVVKLDASGNLTWQRCLGGTSQDEAYDIQQTADGWYIVAGGTHSNDGDVKKENHGNWDFWIVRLDASGNLAWQRCLGGDDSEKAYSIQQTADDEYIVAGYTHSKDGDVSNNHGEEDYWIVKLVGIDCVLTAPDSVCPRSTGNVASTAESGAEYNWTIGNGTITSPSNAQSITFTAEASGPLSLKVYVHKNGYWDQCYKDIPVALANCSWTSKSPVCINSRVFFYGPAGMDSYQWDFGDGSQGSGQNTNHTYSATGNYTVKLNTTLRGCSKSCTGTVRVLSGPECNWTSKSYVCKDEKVQFTGPAGMDSYHWEFGDGQNSTAKDPKHAYDTPGTYPVSLTTTFCGNSKSCTGTVKVLSEPNCSWTSNAPVYNGTPVQFNGPAGMDWYIWDFGDSGDDAGNYSRNASHLYKAPGFYKVNLQTGRCGNKRICPGGVWVKKELDCSWTSNAPVCNGTPVQFTGPAGMDSYYWEFGDGAVSSAKDPPHLYSAARTYKVNLTVTKDDYSKICTGTVVVRAPDCRWTSSSPVYNGTAVQFSGPDGMDAYHWDFGDGAVSSAQGASHRYSAPGTYAVTLNATKGGCMNSCPGTVEVRAPDCRWTSNAPVCNGTPVQFSGPAGMDSYQWDFGDGAVRSAQGASHLYSAPGTYTVSLNATKLGCSETCTGTIRVNTPASCGRAICIDWQKCLGGSAHDSAESIEQTADGGYIVAGHTSSNDGNVSDLHGPEDFWVVKLKDSGGIAWASSIGASGMDGANCIQQTANGWYVVAGYADFSVGSAGLADYLIVDLNPQGHSTWNKRLGGSGVDQAYSILQTADGGYAVAGSTESKDGDVRGYHGFSDYWIVKLGKSRNLVWQKCLGGSQDDHARSILQTADGGYVVAGWTKSIDGDVSGNHGDFDCWIVKLDKSGNLVWQKCLGGSRSDGAWCINQTADGGYVVAGWTKSSNGDVSGNHGMEDYWVVKLNSSGNLTWQKCLGGSGKDMARSIRQTSDGGYVVAGYTSSKDGDVSGNHGMEDYWVVKLDKSGDLVWQRLLGGKDMEEASSVRQTSDGGYIVAGYTKSNDGDVSGNHGGLDFWVVKLREMNCTITAPDVISSGSAGNVASTAESGAAYNWSITNGEITSSPNNQSITFTAGAAGTTTLKVVVTGNGCAKECPKDITVTAEPDCNITAPSSVCAGSTGNAASTASPGASYAWSITNGEITSASNIQSITFTAGASGTTRLEVTVTAAGGCAKKCGKDISVTAGPDCTISAPNAVCAGSTGNAASTAASGAAYAWSITNGEITSASNIQSITFTAGASGTTKLEVTVTAGGCSKECTKDITITAGPDCSWTSSSPVCDGTPVQFTGPSGMDAYSWEFGDGLADSSKDPSHLYSAPGTYSVNLKATKGGCSKTCAGSVVVKPQPDCSWTSNAPVCNGTPVQFTGPAGMDAYEWSFGDGNTSSAEDPSHLYSAPGTYPVSLKATKGGCTKSCTGTVVVAAADCSWTSNAPVCNGTPVQFTGPAGMDSYQWDFGDGQKSEAEDPSHLYSAPGTYTVNLRATKGSSSNCVGSVEVKGPDCSWTSNAPVCNGTTVQFSGPSGMDAYQWDFGDGAVSSAQGASHLYSAPGTYTVSLTVAKSGCSASCRNAVEVTMADCSWTSNSPVCDGTQVQFTGPAGMDAYTWEFGDGRNSSDKDPKHLYSAPGTYVVNLKVTKGGCSKSCFGGALVNPLPDCSWTSNSPVCDGTPVRFTGPAGMYSYQWEFGDGQTRFAKDPGHLYSAPGTFTVSLTVKASEYGCSKSCPGTVEVKGTDCSWTSNAPVCSGTPVQFTGPSGMDAYQWEFGDGAVGTAQNPSHLYSAPGSYAVNLKVTKGGCSRTCSGSVEVKPMPDCNWSSNAPVCDGTPVQFNGPSGMESYQWEFGDGNTSSDKDPLHLYSAPGPYTVNLKATKSGCTKSCTRTVVVLAINYLKWQKCLGGAGEDRAYSFKLTADGGYVVAGYTDSADGNVTGKHGEWDYWIVKLDSSGNLVWQKCLGGDHSESAESIQQTKDGGYIVAGWTLSYNGNVTYGGFHGQKDYWIVKLNQLGDIEWQKCLGGKHDEYAQSVQQTADGGYIVAGFTCSSDGDVSGNHGDFDCWIVKLGSSGNLVWQRCLGGSRADEAQSIQQIADGGYIVAGYTLSNDGDVSGNHGWRDYWIVKLGSSGEIEWKKCLGGSNSDYAQSIQQTADGGYVVAGYTESYDDDVSGYHGDTDYWIVKLNESGDLVWQRCLGGSKGDFAQSIQQTADGGYVVAGQTASNNGDVSGNHGDADFWIVKLDPSGNLAWQKCLGGSSREETYSIQQTTDGDYVVAGFSDSNNGDVSGNHGSWDYWIAKLGEIDCTINAPDSICAGRIGYASIAAFGAEYAWSITNGEITSASNAQSITFTAGATGTTRLEVKVTNADGCSKKCTKDITVTAGPDCTISAPDAVCAGSTGNAASTATSGAAYAWAITNGQITSASNTQSIAFTAGALGTTRLEVTVTAGGCSKKCTKDITVTAGPDCSWTSNAPVCNSTPIQFTGPAEMDAYQWEFGDGSSSTDRSPSHNYSAAGSYDVRLTVSKEGCSRACAGTVVVKPQPDCSWTSNAPVCNGTPVQFTGPAGVDSYYWDFGDGAVSSAQSASHLYSAPGPTQSTSRRPKAAAQRPARGRSRSALRRHADNRFILIGRNVLVEAIMMRLTASSRPLMAGMWSPVILNLMTAMRAETTAIGTAG